MYTINVYHKKYEAEKQVSPHFKVKEFACKDGSNIILISDKLVAVLEQIREHFGKPVIITSGYRTPDWNKEVGGVVNSEHLFGTAADIRVEGVEPKEVAKYAESLMPYSGGIGYYRNFTHIDVRDNRARWR